VDHLVFDGPGARGAVDVDPVGKVFVVEQRFEIFLGGEGGGGEEEGHDEEGECPIHANGIVGGARKCNR
jgi:hypothetical protein